MTKITDINGAALLPLRSVKKQQINQLFSSKLDDAKLKQVAEETVSQLLSAIKSSDEYSILLHSKMSDIVLGRLQYLKAITDVSQDNLNELKECLIEAIQKQQTISDASKELLETSVRAAVNSVLPSDSTDKVLDELHKLDDSVDKKPAKSEAEPVEELTEASEPAPAQAEDTSYLSESSEEINKIKETFIKQISKLDEIPNVILKNLQKPFDLLNNTIALLQQKTDSKIQSSSKTVTEKFQVTQENVVKLTVNIGKDILIPKIGAVAATKTEKISTDIMLFQVNSTKNLTDATLTIGTTLNKMDPAKNQPPPDKTSKKFEEISELFLKVVGPFADSPGEFILDALKKNIKKVIKVLKKVLDDIVFELLTVVCKAILKVFTVIGEFVAKLIAKIVSSLIRCITDAFLPILIAIGASLAMIMAAILNALLKFPELIKPIVESIAKLAELLAKTVVWLITEVFTWLTQELWPFLKNELWGFVTNELWSFFAEKIFPIIERIYTWLYQEFYPFLINEVWPWILELLDKFYTFMLNEFWPFVMDLFKWLRDDIITPVWEAFVKPFLTWVVEKAIPWIAEHVAPVIKTILEIINEFLLAIQPWIPKLFGKIMRKFLFIVETWKMVFTILKPGIMAVVKCIKNLFVNVFNLLKDTVLTIVEFIEILIKAFKQAWNMLCDYFADICIDISTPESWCWPLDGVHIIGPWYPWKMMKGMKFDMGGDGKKAVSQGVQAVETPPSEEGDKEALERLDSYIDWAYSKIFLALSALVKLLGISTSGNPKLQALDAGYFAVKNLRKKDASDKLEKFANNPIQKLLGLVNRIATTLDTTMSLAITELAKHIGRTDLSITATANASKTEAAEKENPDNNKQSGDQPLVDMNVLVDALIADDNAPETDDLNAFSFLKNNLVPILKDDIVPLVSHIQELAHTRKAINNSVVNILECTSTEEMNYALVDQ